MSESNTDARLARIEKMLEREAKHSNNNLAFGAGLALIVFSPGVPSLLSPLVECVGTRSIVAFVLLIVGSLVVICSCIRHCKINRE